MDDAARAELHAKRREWGRKGGQKTRERYGVAHFARKRRD